MRQALVRPRARVHLLSVVRSDVYLLMVLGTVLSCAHQAVGPGAREGNRPAGLGAAVNAITFINRRPESVAVYLASESGAERLLGRVGPLKSAQFPLPRAIASGTRLAYIVVVPISSWHVYMPRKALIPDAIISEPEPVEELLLKRWHLAGSQLAGFINPPKAP